jgi:hypothetical protein
MHFSWYIEIIFYKRDGHHRQDIRHKLGSVGELYTRLVSVAELNTRPAYIIPAYRDLSTLWVKKNILF